MALKKLLGAFLLPFPIALALLLLGLVLLWFTKRQRGGRRLIALSAIVFLAGGYDLMSGALIRPLENAYPALSAAAVQGLTPAPIAVVVLGSGYRPDATALPPNDRLSTNGLARLIEGVRLIRLLPQARLIVSDGFGQGQALAETATFLGVPHERIVLERRSFDTGDEAALLPPLVGGAPFLLVTSAAHMRRAMSLCRKQGLNPIAAPADFIAGGGTWSASDLVPQSSGFSRTDHALHEWIGLAWGRLRGKL
jgi:uncharacterized SAM-binding protein YcdF (DUF218 family)